MEADNNNNQCAPVAPPGSPRRRMEDQCPDTELPQMMAQQRSPGARSRSPSPIQPAVECPQEDKMGQGMEQAKVCICSSPPCTCPCPRGGSRPTPNANSTTAGGRSPRDQNRCAPKPSKQEACGPENYRGRPQVQYNNCAKSPDSYNSSRMDTTSSVSRSGACGGPQNSGRPGQPEVIHCYDNRNVDPTLYERLDKQYMDLAREAGNKSFETNYQSCLAREQADRNRHMTPARRPPFRPLAHSTPIMPDLPDTSRRLCSPQILLTPPSAETTADTYSSSDEYYSTMLSPQSVQQYTSEGAEPCARPNTDTFRKSPQQAVPKSNSCHQASRASDNARMANMINVIQGLKQRAEAHREKCEPAAVRRSPPTDAACQGNQMANRAQQTRSRQQIAFDGGAMPQSCSNQSRNVRPGQQMFYTPQPKPTQQYSPCPERGYGSANMGMQNRQCARQPLRAAQAEFFPPRQQAEECEPAFEQQDECGAGPSENLDQFPQEQQQPCSAPMQQPCSSNMQQPCSAAMQQPCPRGAPRNSPQNFMRGNSPAQECNRPSPQTVQFTGAADDSAPQWVSMNSEMGPSPVRDGQNTFMDGENRCMRNQRGSPQRSSPRRTSPGSSPDSRMAGASSCMSPSTPMSNRQDQTWSSRGTSGGRTPEMSWTLSDYYPTESSQSQPEEPKWVEMPVAKQLSLTTQFQQLGICSRQGSQRSQQSSPRPQQCSPRPQQCSPRPQQCSPRPQQCSPRSQQGSNLQQQNTSCPRQNSPCQQSSSQYSPRGGVCPPANSPVQNQNVPCAPPNSPCPRSAAGYGQQPMNAEPQFQEEFCEDDNNMGQDFQNIDSGGLDTCERPTHSCTRDELGDTDIEILAADSFHNYGDEFTPDWEAQELTGMVSIADAAEDQYDLFQDASGTNCDQMPSSQNLQPNMSMGTPRSNYSHSSHQSQQGCNLKSGYNKSLNYF